MGGQPHSKSVAKSVEAGKAFFTPESTVKYHLDARYPHRLRVGEDMGEVRPVCQATVVPVVVEQRPGSGQTLSGLLLMKR